MACVQNVRDRGNNSVWDDAMTKRLLKQRLFGPDRQLHTRPSYSKTSSHGRETVGAEHAADFEAIAAFMRLSAILRHSGRQRATRLGSSRQKLAVMCFDNDSGLTDPGPAEEVWALDEVSLIPQPRPVMRMRAPSGGSQVLIGRGQVW